MPTFKDECAKKNPWWYEFDIGKNAAGKRIRIRKKGFRTQRDAQKALSEAQNQYNKGTYVEPSKLQYSEYLLDVWLKNFRTSSQGSKRKVSQTEPSNGSTASFTHRWP